MIRHRVDQLWMRAASIFCDDFVQKQDEHVSSIRHALIRIADELESFSKAIDLTYLRETEYSLKMKQAFYNKFVFSPPCENTVERIIDDFRIETSVIHDIVRFGLDDGEAQEIVRLVTSMGTQSVGTGAPSFVPDYFLTSPMVLSKNENRILIVPPKQSLDYVSQKKDSPPEIEIISANAWNVYFVQSNSNIVNYGIEREKIPTQTRLLLNDLLCKVRMIQSRISGRFQAIAQAVG